jgi:hypothetical protein
MGSLAMHQERQPVLPRESCVGLEHAELALHRRSRCARPIEPALSDRDRTAPGEERVESLEGGVVIRLGEIGKKLGVDAQRDLEARIAGGKPEERLPRVRSNRRDEDALEPCFPGAGKHRLAVRVEARDVQVAMRVDQPVGPRANDPTLGRP